MLSPLTFILLTSYQPRLKPPYPYIHTIRPESAPSQKLIKLYKEFDTVLNIEDRNIAKIKPFHLSAHGWGERLINLGYPQRLLTLDEFKDLDYGSSNPGEGSVSIFLYGYHCWLNNILLPPIEIRRILRNFGFGVSPPPPPSHLPNPALNSDPAASGRVLPPW